MELYRALPYSMIGLDPASMPGTAPYTTDAAYSASQVSQTCSGQAQCNASQTVTGPDHGTYRIDTYIVFMTPTDGAADRSRSPSSFATPRISPARRSPAVHRSSTSRPG